MPSMCPVSWAAIFIVRFRQSWYPAFSPNVVAVGGTELSTNGDSYGSETAWSFPPPRTLDHGSPSYQQLGSWTSLVGGSSGTYSTAPAGSSSSATWTTLIDPSDQGWVGGTEVSATWVPSAGNATNAKYLIYDGNATTGTLLDTVSIDQTKSPVGTPEGNTQFQELGDYYPATGEVTVVLSAGSANGTVSADAIGIAPAWATGGGQSINETEPSYQSNVQNSGYRTTPDVSFDGSGNSGVTTWQGGIGYDYYGTSLSCPCWAGIIAIVDQGRVAAGGAPLDSATDPTQTLRALYSLPASDFHDITTGYNGLFAGPGYDELTGRGTPIANLLIPDMVAYGQSTASTPSVVASDAGGTYSGNKYPATAAVTGVAGLTVSGTTTFTYYSGISVSGPGSTTAPTNVGNRSSRYSA